MARIAYVDFKSLDISRKSCHNWQLDMKFHLRANCLLPTTVVPTNVSNTNKAKVMIYIRCHVDKTFKAEYLIVEDSTKF